jgi:hypothetical protein
MWLLGIPYKVLIKIYKIEYAKAWKSVALDPLGARLVANSCSVPIKPCAVPSLGILHDELTRAFRERQTC